jgi:ubiquitin C-terminal hydrolase
MNNLGNICYMSSALQCLVRAPLLVQYFQTLQFRFDLNPKSPLGSKGKVTEEFAK